jgi:hypothetical protein
MGWERTEKLMPKPLHALPLALVVVLGVGCSGGTSGAGPRTPLSSTPATTTAQVPPPPRVGQCRNTPPSHLDTNDWVDNTPSVDCAKSHTLETVEVVQPAEKLTLALVKQLAVSCQQSDVSYLGISFPAIRTLTDAVVYWPS